MIAQGSKTTARQAGCRSHMRFTYPPGMQEHRREMFDLKQDMIAKLRLSSNPVQFFGFAQSKVALAIAYRASNTRENQLKDSVGLV